jgi:hypothetical protein
LKSLLLSQLGYSAILPFCRRHHEKARSTRAFGDPGTSIELTAFSGFVLLGSPVRASFGD